MEWTFSLKPGWQHEEVGQVYGLYLVAIWSTEPRHYQEGLLYPWTVFLFHPHPVPLFDLPYGAVPIATGRALAPGQAQGEAHTAAQDFLHRPPTEDHLDQLAQRITRAWDRWGAPSVARLPSGSFVASFEGPGGPFTTEAPSKREAYLKARQEWIRRILGESS
jgi:hypothetical protein